MCRPTAPAMCWCSARCESVLSVVSFTAILWNLSGTLTLFGVSMPRAMFWILIVYVMVATVIGFWIGRPLIRLSFRNELTNAAFRYALVRVRDAAEAVGFYRGEAAERVQLSRKFRPIIDNYLRYVNRTVSWFGFNISMSQLIVPLALGTSGAAIVRRSDQIRWRHANRGGIQPDL